MMLMLMLMLAQAAQPQAEQLPLDYLPLMQACTASGEQTGFTMPGELGGSLSRDLYISHLAVASSPVRKVTLNAWAAANGAVPVQMTAQDARKLNCPFASIFLSRPYVRRHWIKS